MRHQPVHFFRRGGGTPSPLLSLIRHSPLSWLDFCFSYCIIMRLNDMRGREVKVPPFFLSTPLPSSVPRQKRLKITQPNPTINILYHGHLPSNVSVIVPVVVPVPVPVSVSVGIGRRAAAVFCHL